MANKNPNQENLKPVTSKIEARKRGSVGGKKSAEVRKEKKLLKDTITMMLEMKAPDHLKAELGEKLGINVDTIQDLITSGLMGKAMGGDAKAFEVIRDTINQKPVDKVESTTRNIVVASQKDKDLLDSI